MVWILFDWFITLSLDSTSLWHFNWSAAQCKNTCSFLDIGPYCLPNPFTFPRFSFGKLLLFIVCDHGRRAIFCLWRPRDPGPFSSRSKGQNCDNLSQPGSRSGDYESCEWCKNEENIVEIILFQCQQKRCADLFGLDSMASFAMG